MNRSKLIAASALATAMSATAANAELTLSGFYAGTLADADGGVTHGTSTSSMYVTYTDTLDNGMGLTFNISASGAGHYTDVFIDTGMGTLGLGDGQDSSVDKTDGNPAINTLNKYGPRYNATFNDGDASSGASVMYTSPAVNGFTAKISRGMESATTDPVMSYAVTGSIAGLSLAAGVSSIDHLAAATADIDPSFVTASYSLGGINLGYALYDSDAGSEESHFGVSTALMGMTVGVSFATDDAATDTDYMHIGAIKSLGAMSYSVEYAEADQAGGNANDTDTWNFTYLIGF
jgi:hypothetical protein